jgi:hypothetical protein
MSAALFGTDDDTNDTIPIGADASQVNVSASKIQILASKLAPNLC